MYKTRIPEFALESVEEERPTTSVIHFGIVLAAAV